jgi:hypothetical protein
MLKPVPIHPRPYSLTMTGAAVDRTYLVSMKIADFAFAIVAIGMVCLFFYIRQPVFAFYAILLSESVPVAAQLLWNKRLRQNGIAIQTLLLNLYVFAAVTTLERDVWRKSILGLVFAFMSVRYLVEIQRTLRRARQAGGPGAVGSERKH